MTLDFKQLRDIHQTCLPLFQDTVKKIVQAAQKHMEAAAIYRNAENNVTNTFFASLHEAYAGSYMDAAEIVAKQLAVTEYLEALKTELFNGEKPNA